MKSKVLVFFGKHLYSYKVGSLDIIGTARKLENLRSICAFCSRMKRGRLAAAAQHHGWNVLAMGQHLDDVAER